MDFVVSFYDQRRTQKVISAKNKVDAINYVQNNIVGCGFSVKRKSKKGGR